MGGAGSGRRAGKVCTDELHWLDVRKLQREGFLTAGKAYQWQWTRNGQEAASIHIQVEAHRVILHYWHRHRDGKKQEKCYSVELERTPCRFGGERVWWRCPVPGCGRRVAILFSGALFACRHCHQLAYRSQRETPGDRAIRKAHKVRARLGWEIGVLNPSGDKPKGLHWRTFERLRARENFFSLRVLTDMQATLDAMRKPK